MATSDKIIIYGGNQLRPNIHIKDMSNIYLKILNSDKELVNGEIFIEYNMIACPAIGNPLNFN